MLLKGTLVIFNCSKQWSVGFWRVNFSSLSSAPLKLKKSYLYHTFRALIRHIGTISPVALTKTLTPSSFENGFRQTNHPKTCSQLTTIIEAWAVPEAMRSLIREPLSFDFSGGGSVLSDSFVKNINRTPTTCGMSVMDMWRSHPKSTIIGWASNLTIRNSCLIARLVSSRYLHRL